MIHKVGWGLEGSYPDHMMLIIIHPILIHSTSDENSQEYIKLFKCYVEIRISEKNKFFKNGVKVINPDLFMKVEH